MLEEIREEYKKCYACGYEYEWHKNKTRNEKVITKGKEDFLKIIGRFGYEENEPYKYITEIDLFMCPKCMTVKGNDFQYNMTFKNELKRMTEEMNQERKVKNKVTYKGEMPTKEVY